MSALGMTAIPFAMKKAENWGFWFTCLFFGLFLCLLNYAMAVGAIGKVRDHDAKAIEDLQTRAASLQARIASLKTDIAALPPFKWTTDEMVDTAGTAVALALQAREQESGKVGDL
jgi:F0F1-type ATP synthase membrane subunit b/b'